MATTVIEASLLATIVIEQASLSATIVIAGVVDLHTVYNLFIDPSGSSEELSPLVPSPYGSLRELGSNTSPLREPVVSNSRSSNIKAPSFGQKQRQESTIHTR